MPATITGIVFNDLNHNGEFNVGEPGIPNVFVILYNTTTGVCTPTQTDVNGDYSFTITSAGTYRVYETVDDPGATCPPTNFTQPTGFTMSNGPRELTVAVTASQISLNATIGNQNFSHDTVDNPLECNTRMIQFVSTPTQWYNINVVTGTSTLQGNLNPADYVNAIGYNILDNYIYGYDVTTNHIVRIDNSGNIITLSPLPTGLPVNGYNVGTFDLSGFLYITMNDLARYYTIDLRPNSATFMKLVDPTNGYVEETSNYGTVLNPSITISDWVFNPNDGNLYGISISGTSTVLRRIVPTTGNTTGLTTTTTPALSSGGGGSFGAIAIDSNGIIYGVWNINGRIYKYTFTGNTARGILFSTTFFANQNDATMCPTAAIRVDYGDAPDTGSTNGQNNYNTLLDQNGPRHQLINNLLLGTQVTAETDAYQNSTATGDDLILGVQDDGLTVPLNILSISASTYSLDVTVTNETGVSANLYGWIDFNENGLFQGNEAAAVQIVPSLLGTQVFTLNFTVPSGVVLNPPYTFVRLRLTTDTLTNTNGPTLEDTRSVGAASDGEVEDYLLEVNAIADLEVIKTTTPNPVINGSQLTYNIVVNNNGPDSAENVVLEDIIPSEVLNAEYSLDGGITFSPWTGSINLGTIASGDSITVLIRGTLNQTATGNTTNTATVSSTTEDPDETNNTSTSTVQIAQSADISIIKSAIPSPIIAGEEITYTLLISNAGPSESQDVILTDSIPATILSPEFSIDGGVTFNPWTGSYTVGNLPDGASETILIRGTVNSSATGSITNTATVDSTTPDPDPANNTSTIVTPISESADISVVKTGSPNPAVAGQLLTYTLVVSNAGLSDAQNVVLTDSIPATVLSPEFSIDGGVTFNPWTGSYTIGTLIEGAAQTIIIRGTVSPSAIDSITNTATVDSTTPDPDSTNNTSTIEIPLNTSADISVVKTASPNPAVVGQLLTYTLVVANVGPANAQNVILTDVIPVTISSPEFSIDGGVTFNPWTGSYTVGTLIEGASQTIIIRGTVNPSATGSITNTATVDSTTPDPDPTNNTSTIETPLNLSADISVVKTASPNPVISGEQITYNLLVSNAGLSDAQNVVLTDAIPATILSPEFSIDGGVTFNPWTGSYNIGTLVNGASINIIIEGTVNPSATGSITNTATVDSTTPDPDPTNNTSTVVTQVITSADISIVKTSSQASVIAGEEIDYTLVVSNAGPSDALNVNLADTIPVSITSAEFSTDGGVTFNPWSGSYIIGTLGSGDSITVLIKGIVSSTTGSITNTATVNSITPDPDPTNNTSTVVTQVIATADISVVKTASPVVAGNQITYTLVVANEGPSDAQNVSLTDVLPATITGEEFSTDGGVTFNPWTGSYTIGTLIEGASQTIIIRGTVSSAATGSITNTATVDSTTPDPDPTNNTSEIITPIGTSADISVVKTVSPNPVVAGQIITYSLVVSNAGPSDAQNVTLTDNIPVVITGAEFSIDGGVTFNPWVTPYIIGTLANGESETIIIRGTVSPSATGGITNTARVNSTTPDPNPTNNSSTITTQVTTSADISIVKMGSPNPAIVGQTITYTLVVANAGPSDAQNVIVADNIPTAITGAEFSIDGGANFNPWVSPYIIGELGSGISVTILIRGTVSQSAGTSISNTATVSSPTPDPNPNNNTSTIIVEVISPELTLQKSSNISAAVVGDIIRYTIVATNTGKIPLQSVVVTDLLTPDLQFEDNLTIDGVPSSQNITTGVDIGNLDTGDFKTISFDAEVIEIPVNEKIENTSTAVFNYQVSGNVFTGTSTSNKVTITVFNPQLTVTKTASKRAVKVGGTFNYTIKVKNTDGIEINNVIVTDTLPAELSVIGIQLDGVPIAGDIGIGINIGTILPGQTKTVVLEIQALASLTEVFNNVAVASGIAIIDPSREPIEVTASGTDTVGVQVFNPELTLAKSVDKLCSIVGDILTYKIVATNTGDITLGNVPSNPVVVYDILNSNLEFISGTVSIDEIPKPLASIISGVDLGVLQVGESKTITFKVKILSNVINPTTNTGRATFGYQLPESFIEVGNAISNMVSVNVQLANINIVKMADKSFTVLGDTITYTVTLTNTGKVDALNVIFTDDLPNIVQLVDGSFSVDGNVVNNVDIRKGINIGTIGVGQEAIVKYTVKVVNTNCKLKVINSASVKFSYVIDNCGSGSVEIKGTPQSTTVVDLGISNFKQFSVEKDLVIPSQKPCIEEILEVSGSVEIVKKHIIKVPKAESEEGQILTGSKLIVHGVINEFVEYTALNLEQSLHVAHYSIPFTTFIVLPEDFYNVASIRINSKVEDIYFKKLDDRSIFTNATVLISAIILDCE